eukprot:scaffold21556_cov120-Isochrysis_galbana.AAC.2
MPINYSKWDKLELSDDEDNFHPNIDNNLMIRLQREKRQQREKEEAEKKKKLLEVDAGARCPAGLEWDRAVRSPWDRGPPAGAPPQPLSSGLTAAPAAAPPVQEGTPEALAEVEKIERMAKLHVGNICTDKFSSKHEKTKASASADEPKPQVALEASGAQRLPVAWAGRRRRLSRPSPLPTCCTLGRHKTQGCGLRARDLHGRLRGIPCGQPSHPNRVFRNRPRGRQVGAVHSGAHAAAVRARHRCARSERGGARMPAAMAWE